MMYNNPQATTEWLQQEYFNLLLKTMTEMNKPIKAQELAELLFQAKKLAAACVDVVRHDLFVANNMEALKFWNEVHKNLNQ